MKKISALIFAVLFLLAGCGQRRTSGASVAATTLPVYQFTQRLCQGTDITVNQVITEPVSCLHDYSLTVRQMQLIESADAVVLSGAGLEDFMGSALDGKTTIDASAGIALLQSEEGADPHIWMDPTLAQIMAQNIALGLENLYPDKADAFAANLEGLLSDLADLAAYGQEATAQLSGRQLITFHDGFSYFAQSADLEILAAIEEEAGSEASAADLEAICRLVREHQLPAIFTEANGSTAAASVVSSETGVAVFQLSMCLSGEDYFALMRENYDTIKEALG